MKVALITNGIWPYVVGGMQKHSYYLAKYFARNKIYVDLYHCSANPEDAGRLDCFSDEEKKYIYSIPLKFPSHIKTPWRYLSESYQYSKSVYNIFRQRPPVDYVYTKSYTAWYFLKQKQKGALLPPVAIRLHGYEIFQPSRGLLGWYRKQIYLKLVRFLNAEADYVYSYGEGISRVIKNNIPAASHKIIEIPAGIEHDWIYHNNKSVGGIIKFVFVGRYDRRKGIDELNCAIRNILSDPGLNFVIAFVGPIPESKKIHSTKVSYLGLMKKKEDIQKILQTSDVFVLPSHSEGMPNVVLEAMANGCAILATDIAAVPVMVSERNGWLIPPIDIKALTHTLKSIINLPKIEIEKRKEESIKSVETSFLWTKIIQLEIEAIKDRIN